MATLCEKKLQGELAVTRLHTNDTSCQIQHTVIAAIFRCIYPRCPLGWL